MASNAAQAEAWEETVEKIGAAVPDSPFEQIELDVARRRGGSQTIQGGTFEHGPASVHPGKLVRGMRDVALKRGIEIFEHTAVLGLSTGDPAVVRTARGQVRAARVVLGTHWGLASIPELRRCSFVVSSDVLATGSGSGPSRAARAHRRRLDLGLETAADLLPHDHRRTARVRQVERDPRVRRADHSQPDGTGVAAAARDPVRCDVSACIRALRDAPIANVWTGPADRSSNGLPFFGRLKSAPHISFGAGYSGNGVAPSRLGGRVLASLVLDLDDEFAAAAEDPASARKAATGADPLPRRPDRARRRRAQGTGRGRGPRARPRCRSSPRSLVPATFVPVREPGEKTHAG